MRSTEENVAFHQIMSAMSRGVPVVSTTAAAVALPGFGDILGSIPAYSKKSDTAAPVLLLADDAHSRKFMTKSLDCIRFLRFD